MKRVSLKSFEGFNEFLCKLVCVLLCSHIFSTLCTKMMIKLMKNHEGILKFLLTHYMNCLGLGNVTPDFLTVFLGHSNLQMWNTNAIMMTKSLDGFISFFHENQLNNLGFEQMFMFMVGHLEFFLRVESSLQMLISWLSTTLQPTEAAVGRCDSFWSA